MASASKALNIIVEDSKHCTPCKTKDKKIESKYYCTDCEAYYCEECFELHPRVPYLAKHIVLKHDDIAVWSNLQYKCTTHDKNLEFFCGMHKVLCCHVCVSLEHRSCADMEYILESAKNICKSDEIKTMIQGTQEKLDKIESYANKIKQKTEVNEQSKEEYIKELEEYRTKLNKMFDDLMKNALVEMNERVDRNAKYSEEMTQELKNFEQELQELKHQLTTATAGKEVLIYISLKRGENIIEEITRKLSEIDITTDKDNFKPVLDNTIQEYIGNIKQIVYLEDEQMRKEAVSREKCLVQSAVSSEEYQELTSVSYEGDKMTNSVQCEHYEGQMSCEEIYDIVQINVPCKDTVAFAPENSATDIEVEEIVLLTTEKGREPKFVPIGKHKAHASLCKNYQYKHNKPIANKCFDTCLDKWDLYRNTDCCSNCGERFKSKLRCQECGQKRK
ncbi:E3 ubiquitin-protein ligase TRIM9-like [Mercenaria mercenaria]|uniref:E3 ubiquitin-protein ligase TRIM9-like n=1 Tax=Mercenaria mercenaria TaxID=6596 RepID=UPI00234ED6A9|nr:E3 ubiquitin-protein ligase TRIM9-like [Mercenaria mercenaria]